MESIYIDTSLLAVPNYCSDSDAAADTFDIVTRIASLLSTDIPILVVVSDTIEQDLWGNNLGPDYEALNDLVDFFDLSRFYAAKDLYRTYQAVIERSSREKTSCKIVIRSTGLCVVAPNILTGLSPAVLLAETKRLASGVAALLSVGERWSFCSSITSPANNSFNIEVELQDAVGISRPELGPLPTTISATIPLFSSLDDWITATTSERFWSRAESAKCLHFSITLGAIALLRQSEGKNHQPPRRFSIGPKFLDSLTANQSYRDGKFSSVIRELCSQLIAKKCAKAVGPFGRPNQTLRPFDGAKAWRVHATKGSEGLRLMYWEKSNGLLEFANVGVKHELLIEPGSGETAIQLECEGLLLGN